MINNFSRGENYCGNFGRECLRCGYECISSQRRYGAWGYMPWLLSLCGPLPRKEVPLEVVAQHRAMPPSADITPLQAYERARRPLLCATARSGKPPCGAGRAQAFLSPPSLFPSTCHLVSISLSCADPSPTRPCETRVLGGGCGRLLAGTGQVPAVPIQYQPGIRLGPTLQPTVLGSPKQPSRSRITGEPLGGSGLSSRVHVLVPVETPGQA